MGLIYLYLQGYYFLKVKPIQDIRIIQLIDSLEPGGAERMAVTIANTLATSVAFSGIVVTRLEGSLASTISPKVPYLFLKKSSTFDIGALLRFRKFVQQNKVHVVHAHGSSYFFAVLLKLTLPSLRVFWHDHLGNRVHEERSNFFIVLASYFFSGVFTVNQALQTWALHHLKTDAVQFIPNFIEENATENHETFLKGTVGKRIVLLANLRAPKNHALALAAFSKSNIADLGWTLHFVGKDSNDAYATTLKNAIAVDSLESSVFIYGSCTDVHHILQQSDVGLLTSTYEGFPVTLLEYGNANLLVICSDVGYCSQLIENAVTGICFPSEDVGVLTAIFSDLPNNYPAHTVLANNLNTFVRTTYSASSIVHKLVASYQNAI